MEKSSHIHIQIYTYCTWFTVKQKNQLHIIHDNITLRVHQHNTHTQHEWTANIHKKMTLHRTLNQLNDTDIKLCWYDNVTK